MGRRTAPHIARTAPLDHRVRTARAEDAAQLRDLLALVGFDDPATPAVYAAGVAASSDPRLLDGTITVLVLDDPDRGLLGAATSSPLAQLQAIADTPQLFQQVTTRVVDLESVAVRPDARGQRLGVRLVDELATRCARQGRCLMTGTFHDAKAHLADYYRGQGFTVLPSGAPAYLRMPNGRVAVLPPAQGMRQMWRPLDPRVTTRPLRRPAGVWDVIEGAF